MKVTALDEDIAALLAKRSEGRSEGVHLSQIIRSLCQQLEPARFKDTDLPWNKFAAGFMWEEALKIALVNLYESGANGDIEFHPGEFRKDGIIGSPDAIYLPDWELEEYKLTWASARRDIADDFFTHYVWQVKGYCHMVGAEAVRMRMFYVMGDYRNSGPLVRSWRLEFSQLELEENWNMVLNEGRRRGWL